AATASFHARTNDQNVSRRRTRGGGVVRSLVVPERVVRGDASVEGGSQKRQMFNRGVPPSAHRYARHGSDGDVVVENIVLRLPGVIAASVGSHRSPSKSLGYVDVSQDLIVDVRSPLRLIAYPGIIIFTHAGCLGDVVLPDRPGSGRVTEEGGPFGQRV